MSDAFHLNHPSVVQDPKTTAWTGSQEAFLHNPPVKSQVVSSKPTSEGQTTSQSSTSQCTHIATNPPTMDTPMRESSPELEIMEVRKVQRPVLASGARLRGPVAKPRISGPNPNTSNIHTHPLPTQKRESFDMSLIDPALRGIGASVSSPDPQQQQAIGTKRSAEAHGNTDSKRIKATTPSTGCILKSIEREDSIVPETPARSAPVPSSVAVTPPTPSGITTPQWQPNTWSPRDYMHMIYAVERTFNFRTYAAHVRKHPQEIIDVFRGIVIYPIMEHIDSVHPPQLPSLLQQQNQQQPQQQAAGSVSATEGPPNQGRPGTTGTAAADPEALMLAYKAAEAQMVTALEAQDAEKLAILKKRAMAEIGAELRAQIEAEIRAQLQAEGWVQLHKAKDLIAGYEREIKSESSSNSNPESSSGGSGEGGNGKKGKPKVKPFADAQKDLLQASIMFEKARKAEERRAKAAEREAAGGGGAAGEKKVGKGKKGDGYGKGDGKGKGGGDFV